MKARVFLVLLFVCLWIFWDKRADTNRLTVAISSDPVVIWSWDSVRKRGTLIKIPSDSMISASYALGSYPVASLWELGKLHGKKGDLFTDSLEDALAIPIPWYIGKIEDASNAFSLRNFASRIIGSYETNISPLIFFKLMVASSHMKPSNTVVIDLFGDGVLQKKELPDGSTAIEINQDVWDSRLDHEFEDISLRQEAIPIGVYNTTKTSTVGSRMSRLITHLGGNVVLVRNSKEDVSEKCQLVGSIDRLKSYTARFLASELGCTVMKNTKIIIDDRVELAIFVGKEYAKRFNQN